MGGFLLAILFLSLNPIVWLGLLRCDPIAKSEEKSIQSHRIEERVTQTQRIEVELVQTQQTEEKLVQTQQIEKKSIPTKQIEERMSQMQRAEPGLHVVIAFCDKPIDWVWKNYLSNVTIKSAFVFAKCGAPPLSLPPFATVLTPLPNVGGCDHTYSHFMSLLMSPSYRLGSSVGKDDFLLFLKDDNTTDIQISFEEGSSKLLAGDDFVCTQRNKERLEGISGLTTQYFETSKLQTYQTRKKLEQQSGGHINGGFKSSLRPLGKWASAVGIPLADEDIVPICFGGNFLVTARQARKMSLTKSLDWAKITASLARDVHVEEEHYMERSWASIFSNPLPSDLKRYLRARQVGVCEWRESYLGMILVNETKRLSPPQDTSETKQRQVHIVVAYCDQPLHWIWNNYLVDVSVTSAHVFARCGENSPSDLPPYATLVPLPGLDGNEGGMDGSHLVLGNFGFDHTYAHFVSLLLADDNQLESSLMEDDSIILFLHDSTSSALDGSSKQLSFKEVEWMLPRDGFACVKRTKEKLKRLGPGSTTMYFDGSKMRLFSMEEYEPQNSSRADEEPPMRPLGKWASEAGIPLGGDILPVCLGGSFMTTIQQIKHVSHTKRLNWTKITRSLANVHTEGLHYMERSWASIFSNPLSNELKDFLEARSGLCRSYQDYFSGMILVNDTHKLSLLLKNNHELRPLQEDPALYKQEDGTRGLHVVVAYCDKPLDWIWYDYLFGVTVKSAHVFSRCGNTPSNLPSFVTLMPLPNVGECDYVYAYFVSLLVSEYQQVDSSIGEDDVVLFLKDNNNLHRFVDYRISFNEVQSKISEGCFVCIQQTKMTKGWFTGGTDYFETSKLQSFSLDEYEPQGGLKAGNSTELQAGVKNGFQSPFRPLGRWVSAMGIPLDDITPVCLGGYFVISVRQIRQVSQAKNLNWTKITNSLTRGINLEEAHYMERLWSPIFSDPLSAELKDYLRANQDRVCGGMRKSSKCAFGWIVLNSGNHSKMPAH